MPILIDNKTVFYSAIESMRYDSETSEFVLRTVSGDEIRETVSGKERAEELIRHIVNKKSLFETVLHIN